MGRGGGRLKVLIQGFFEMAKLIGCSVRGQMRGLNGGNWGDIKEIHQDVTGVRIRE